MTGKELYRKYDHVSKIENEDDVFTYIELPELDFFTDYKCEE